MSITEASTKILEIPALGRDFREGALYDARNDKMVMGYSLWNSDDLKKIEIISNVDTNYLMNASDTLSEKFEGLDMSASVQLSILSGLIELGGGSASYLTKEINTVGESSVQVRCFFKTGYKEMTMDQLTNIRFLDVARTGNNNTATHFVMKIQYGAGAVFTFTKQFQRSQEVGQANAKADLNICGKTILSVLDGSLAGNYRNYSSSSQIQCEFQSFGLSLSESLPTTYDEAVRFAGKFGRMAHQSMARHGGEALGVPCIVWLSPLVALPGCANAPKLYYDLTYQAFEWIEILDDCDKIEKKLDLHDVFFPKHESDLNRFIDNCREKTELVTQLRSDGLTELKEMIVQIRSGFITFDDFNQKTSSIAKRLDSVGGWIVDNEEFFETVYDKVKRQRLDDVALETWGRETKVGQYFSINNCNLS